MLQGWQLLHLLTRFRDNEPIRERFHQTGYKERRHLCALFSTCVLFCLIGKLGMLSRLGRKLVDGLCFIVFNIDSTCISVISNQWKVYIIRLCATGPRLRLISRRMRAQMASIPDQRLIH